MNANLDNGSQATGLQGAPPSLFYDTESDTKMLHLKVGDVQIKTMLTHLLHQFI